MKTTNMTKLALAAVLMTAGSALADEGFKKSAHGQSFLAKRPYHEVVTNEEQNRGQWEGATLVADESGASVSELNERNKVLRVNMLSKRPY